MKITEQIERLEGQNRYCNEVLNCGNLELWEAKEYTSIIESNSIEIKRLLEIEA